MQDLFSRRVVAALVLFGVASFLGGLLYVVQRPPGAPVVSHGADTFSASAVGYRGLVELMRRLDVPVLQSRARTGRKAAPGTVLFLAEPPADGAEDLLDLVTAAEPDAVVLVLPKWAADEADARGWVTSVRPAPVEAAQAVYDALGLRGVVERVPPGDGVAVASPAQVVRGGELEPLVVLGGDVVVGVTHAYGEQVVVVADPDLVNNAGLARAGNPEQLVRVLARVAPAATALVFDETLHGHAAPESVWHLLLEFPLVLVPLQAGVVVLLLLWAATRRFGAPAPPPRALGRGAGVLIEHTALLLGFGGHSGYALARYWQVSVRGVREALHAPHDAEGPALWAWLAQVGRARGVEVDPGALDAAVAAAGRGHGRDVLAVARRIHAWRAAMSRGRSG